jgi:hypothetical protein
MFYCGRILHLHIILILVTGLIIASSTTGLVPILSSLSRRDALISAIITSTTSTTTATTTIVGDESNQQKYNYDYENRDRKSNKDALIREDYWYMMGKTPPRLLNGPIQQDDPKWNSFGSCQTSAADGATSNSCTYVSLKQRIPIYSKYGFNIALGSKEYQQLGKAIENQNWNVAQSYIMSKDSSDNNPTAIVDALLKMVLFASGMLTSPNYSGPNKRLLVARFYVNELKFAVAELQDALLDKNYDRAIAAYKFGKDSLNSYFLIVNESISNKVGDQFELIP